MSFYTPWIVTLAFGFATFVAGLYFQREERKRRVAKRAAEEQQRQFPVSLSMANMIAGNRQPQRSPSAGTATASTSGLEVEMQSRTRGLN
ncbi:MAG: hypothetical protein ACRD8A_06660 [Candidatus Acidiferrales bacterium]